MGQATLPEYKKIANKIIELIHNGQYMPGTFLPSENQLATEYKVARPTIRKALDILKNLESIESFQGKGYQVKSIYWEQSLLKFYSFGRDIAKKVSSTQTKLLSLKRSSGLNDIVDYNNEELWEITRLRLIENLPLILETSSIPTKFLNIKMMEFETKSLYSLLEENGFHIFKAREYLEAVNPTLEQQNLLEIKRSNPLFKTVRFSYDNLGVLIELRESLIRSDHFRFSVEMEL